MVLVRGRRVGGFTWSGMWMWIHENGLGGSCWVETGRMPDISHAANFNTLQKVEKRQKRQRGCPEFFKREQL